MSSDARMLLIDDDAAFCTVLARRLQREGIACDIAHDATSALRLLDASPPDARPQRILLDLRLGADNGLALIHALRERCPNARIVLATGYASIATAVEAVRLGARHYLAKPADADEILAALMRDQPDAALEVSPEPLSVARLEWEHIQKVLNEHDGNISATARALKMHRRTLQRKLDKRPPKAG